MKFDDFLTAHRLRLINSVMLTDLPGILDEISQKKPEFYIGTNSDIKKIWGCTLSKLSLELRKISNICSFITRGLQEPGFENNVWTAE